MRAVVREFTLRSIQSALDEVCRAVTSLLDSRSDGVTVARTEDISKPSAGRIGYNATTGKLARFDGNAWVDL